MNKLITYIKNSFNEVIYNVTWPSASSLQESTVLVIVGSAIFGLLIFGIDLVLKYGSGYLYK